ncbi:MAG: preprotein translocase subunit YajC [Candidatus Scalindua rubra]|uniref:Sec translocon accessory complex subunit YajC n=1 Tax=Candidatus Scalindua rubra TaxID=1872076 RepID=A0A1E3X9N2_9BACT|nr:MAG: preprotein translocase subunit YajC [Candidatus Scalindua rubra]
MDFLMEATGNKGFGGMGLMLPFILMFAILYLLIIRPQRTKERHRKEMIANIRKHDRIVTVGGVHGVVISVKENEVIARVDDKKDVKLKIDKSAITSVTVPQTEQEEIEE